MAPKEVIAPKGAVTSELLTPLTEADYAFRFVKDSVASEGLNFLAFSDSGHYCFISIILANLVLKKHALLMTFKLYDEKFNCITITRNYDGKDDMSLSPDKCSSTFDGNNLSYDHENRSYTLLLQDSKPTKEGPKVEGTWLDLTFKADSDPFKMGTGHIYYGKDKEDYASQGFLMPKAKVTGKAVIAGKEYSLDGSGFVSKNLTNISPHKVAKTIHHCKFVTPDLTLALCKIQTPKACNNVSYTWGFLVDGGKTVAVSTDVDAVWLQDGVVDPETKYLVPTKVNFKWNGVTADGRDFTGEVIADIKKENLLCRFDVLGHIPAVFRVVVEKLIAKPIFYQYFEQMEATIKIGDETKVVKGKCLHEYHFIND